MPFITIELQSVVTNGVFNVLAREAFLEAGGTIMYPTAVVASGVMINGDAPPVEPDWAVEGKTVQNPCGYVDPNTIVFFQTKEMRNGLAIKNTELSDQIWRAGLKPGNANVLIFLEQNQNFLANVPKHVNCLLATETRFDGKPSPGQCNPGRKFLCLYRKNDSQWRLGDRTLDNGTSGVYSRVNDAAVAFPL